ncbi:MAG: PAS domain S-box protein [Nitrospirae bacterium]|nr:PAS domain S-box protein [Nitrospirota bacterium]
MSVDRTGSPPGNPIGRRLLVRVLLISLLITVFFTAVQAWIDYRSRLIILQDNLEHVRYGEIGGIVTALWHFDRQQLDALVEGLDHIRYINYAAVLDGGVVVSEAGVKRDKNILIQKIPLVREHNGKAVELGLLYLQADISEVSRDVLNKIAILFLFQAVTVSIVAVFLLVLFKRLVTRHLSAAADFFRSFRLDRLHIPLKLNKRRHNDEIDVLADAFNMMLENLSEAYQKQLSAQQKMAESEERLSLVMEATSDGLFDWSISSGEVFFSARCLAMLGYPPEELPSSFATFKSLLHPGDRPIAFDVVRQYIHNKINNHEVEFRLKTKAGGWSWVLSRGRVVLRDAEGTPLRIVGTHVDITERKKLEVCLINAKSDWERTFDSVDDPIMLLNNDFVIMRSNRAMARLLGTTPREVVGLTCNEVVLSTHGPGAVCPYADMLIDGNTHSMEVHDEVTGRHYLISVSPVLDPKGNMTGAIHISKDVTSLKLAEAALLSRQKALESVYGLATTLGGSFESICKKVVVSLSDLLDVPHVMIQQVEEGRASVISFLSDGILLPGGEPVPEDYPCPLVYSTRKSYQVQGPFAGSFSSKYGLKSMVCVPVIGASGELAGVIDVMDRKKRMFSDDDIHLIEIFSSYIAFEVERKKMELRLFKIQEMETIGKIASGVAHEVRNPLNAIMALSEALVAEGASDEQSAFLLHIRAQVERLSQLMSDLLNVGKPIEAENMQQVSIWELCAGAVDSWKQSAYGRTHRVNIMTNPDGISPEVKVDTQKIQQVLINLLDNAAQHSPEGSEILLHIFVPTCCAAIIRVMDQGKGIPGEIRHRVFEPFFTTRRKGTGLGLAIVKNIIEKHGGTVTTVNNDPSPGCTFEINLPLAKKGES